MKQFGDLLRDLRESRDLKQSDVAKDLFISNKVLSSYERNVAFPSLETFKKICEYYNVSADYLLQTDLKKEEEEPATDTPQLTALTQSQSRLLWYYDQLDKENQDAIRGLMIVYYKEQQRKRDTRRMGPSEKEKSKDAERTE